VSYEEALNAARQQQSDDRSWEQSGFGHDYNSGRHASVVQPATDETVKAAAAIPSGLFNMMYFIGPAPDGTTRATRFPKGGKTCREKAVDLSTYDYEQFLLADGRYGSSSYDPRSSDPFPPKRIIELAVEVILKAESSPAPPPTLPPTKARRLWFK
jgi:hypothetical protein